MQVCGCGLPHTVVRPNTHKAQSVLLRTPRAARMDVKVGEWGVGSGNERRLDEASLLWVGSVG